MSVRDEIEKAVVAVGMKGEKFRSSDIIDALAVSATPVYVSIILRQMSEDGRVLKEGGGRYTTYVLPKFSDRLQNSYRQKIKNQDLDEYDVLQELRAKTPFLRNLKRNTGRIFDYAFTEMLNNAIEHSTSKSIDVEVYKSGDNLIFSIVDHGIGVYRNVQKKKHLRSEIEAMQEILKGKTTTMPTEHSGEGIFFTSKISDVFILESYGFKLRVDNLIDDIFYEEKRELLEGTKVTFVVALETERTTTGVFRQYAADPEEGGFDKTKIRVKLYAGGSTYISRSQARRIMDGLADKFKTIILDFDRISTVGQAFVDEIFRVFRSRHPEIEIVPINTNDVTKFMIERVDSPTD